MQLEVVTPRGKLLEAQADEITAPGTAGEFGVLPGHAPLLTGLRPGVVSWHSGQSHGSVAIGKGFAQVVNDRVIVLVDEGMKAEDVDLAAAQKDSAAAESEITRLTEDAGARADVEQRRDWAQARIRLAGGTAVH